jgi:hypothetical protein
MTNSNQPHSGRAHAKRSPSSLGNYAVCPHYLPDNDRPLHPVTVEGTAIHEAIEKRDLGGLSPDARQIAQTGIRYWDGLLATRKNWRQYVEIRIDIPHMGFGHADLVMLSPDETQGVLVDWKTGYNAQAAVENNIQQRAYASGLFRRFPKLRALEIHVVYVRLLEADINLVTLEDCPQIELELIAIDRRAEEAEQNAISAHNPDPAVCTYCVKAGVCPALNKLALPVAEAYAKARPEALTVPEAYDPALITDPAVMAKALVVADIMERWSESVRKHAVDLRLDSGVEIPGYTLVNRKGSTSVIDPQLVYSLAQEAGLDHAAIMGSVNMSVPKLLDAIRDTAPKGQKKHVAQEFEDTLRDSGAVMIAQDTYHLRKSRAAS